MGRKDGEEGGGGGRDGEEGGGGGRERRDGPVPNSNSHWVPHLHHFGTVHSEDELSEVTLLEVTMLVLLQGLLWGRERITMVTTHCTL